MFSYMVNLNVDHNKIFFLTEENNTLAYTISLINIVFVKYAKSLLLRQINTIPVI